MATDQLSDLRAFRDLADLIISRSEGKLRLDETLGLWESENQDADGRAATVQAARRHAGWGTPTCLRKAILNQRTTASAGVVAIWSSVKYLKRPISAEWSLRKAWRA